MGTKYDSVNDSLCDYLSGLRSDASDQLLKQLRAETAKLGAAVAKCQISDEQGNWSSRAEARPDESNGFRCVCPFGHRGKWLSQNLKSSP